MKNIGRDVLIVFLLFAAFLALNIFVFGDKHEPSPIADPPVESQPDRGTGIDT